MKILFWNVMRLGGNSPSARRRAIDRIWLKRIDAQVSLFCEVLQNARRFNPVNFNFRRRNRYQLCYGAVKRGRGRVNLRPYVPRVTQSYKDLNIQGRTTYSRMVNRKPAHAGKIDGIDVYIFHAPSGKGAQPVVFLAHSLITDMGNKPWLLVGDLNAEPDDLLFLDQNLAPFIKTPRNGATYHSRHSSKLYDYVLSNHDVRVSSFNRFGGRSVSDHAPVLVDW